MSTETYKGTFSVTNLTNATITSVLVEHHANSHPHHSKLIEAASIKHNGTVEGGVIQTDNASKDHWYITFNHSAHVKIGICTCGFEEKDSGSNVAIVLYNGYYNIGMPKSSSCNDKSYEV